MSTPRHFRARRDEEGSALVLALVFLTVLGVFIGAVLSFGSTSLRTTIAVREQRDFVYAADGAVDGAINAIRSDASLGKKGGLCPDFVAPFYEADPSRTKTVTVACSGLSGSGASTGGSSSTVNMPAQAVLALAASGEDGLLQDSNNELRIRGSVVSGTTVHVPVDGASLTVVNGTVTATDGCTGNGTVTPACTAPTGPVIDPGYGKRSDAPATPGPYRNLEDQEAACTVANSTVTFHPGLYTDAVSLSALTSATGSCPNSLFWFEPGVYYFDFVNAGSHEWTVSGNGTMVVAGEPNGWVAATPKPSVSFPGACKTADDGGTDGVQFIFGGDSRVYVNDAQFELCAKPTASEQQIAIYGMPSGATPAAATATRVPTTNPANSSPGFTAPSNAYAIDETPTRLTTDFGATNPSANVTGSVTLAGFGLGSIPPGSRITGVQARVAHEETGDVNALELTVTSSTGSTSISSSPGACNASKLCMGSYRTQNFDVSSVFPTTDALASASLAYDTTIKKNQTGSEKLDGVALVVTYVPPAYRALSGCLVAVPYSAPGGSGSAPCPNATSPAALLTTRGAPTDLSLVGSVYAPTAAIDIQLTNPSSQVIRRGIIARTIRVQVTGSSIFTGNAIELPAGSSTPPADRQVLFTAQIDAVTRLRAVVRFTDAGGATPGQSVKVEEWSVRR